MRGKIAKALRRMARDEMSANPEAVERELLLARVRGANRVVNEPMSVRAMNLQLKQAYKNSVRSGGRP